MASLHPLVSELGSKKTLPPEPVRQPKVSGLRFTPLAPPFVLDSNLLSPCLNLVLYEGLR